MTDLEEKILQAVKEFANGDLEIFDYKGLSKFIAESLSLPSVIDSEKTARLQSKIENAKNCLVCGAIADPMEVIQNTLAILESE